MLRLLQGDVGSGKTIVAVLAMLQAVGSGYQAAMMVPTDLLALQQFNVLRDWLAPLGVSVGLLTGRQKASIKRANQASIESGEWSIVVGTHALFQEAVSFKCLGLLVIDEQHRFGVEQRMAFRNKGVEGDCKPHQLLMTATPIPRTLAMIMYSDFSVSTIDELPPGRQPIDTIMLCNTQRDRLIQRLASHCKKGQQAYWVCTLVEESEHFSAQAASELLDTLQLSLPGLKIGLAHGQLKSDKKEAVMSAFKLGEIDILVATTVVEVGVDVSNATLMIIDNAERLGLAQLHQLRGRVGRGSAHSYCVLLYQSPLSAVALLRLKMLRSTQNGFLIAQEDLKIRGPGEVLGVRQTGLMRFRVADLVRDEKLLPLVLQAAERILSDYPGHVDLLKHRWLQGALKYREV